jgi:hypothetical protein
MRSDWVKARRGAAYKIPKKITNPASSDRVYDDDEWEFISAVRRHLVIHKKSYPSHEDVFNCFIRLGYGRKGNNDLQSYIEVLEEYKKQKGRMFPTLTECFHILQSLGYTRERVCTLHGRVGDHES